tara:strand:+ start:262 stop:1017 length:756 start_codon:yes stop_codon:yes gene_type:complete
MRNFISDNTGILIRIDDIAENMNWDLMEKCEVLFDKYNIKPILGVIPNNQDQELMNYPKKANFWDKVRQWKSKGWEISMHGYAHLYDQKTNKKDYFGYGGKSEFFGHKFEVQKNKIEKGLKKFADENIKIRSFYAPNHTYDFNTFRALKECKINNIIDGYGLMPYSSKGLSFFPQLFYKVLMLPFGIQCTQIHLNYWKENEFNNFENFIKKNYKKVISFDDAILKINDGIFYKLTNFLLEKVLKFIRIFKN